MLVLAVALATVNAITTHTLMRSATTPVDVSVLRPVRARTGRAQGEDCTTT